MNGLAQDVRYGLRLLRRSPVGTLAALGSLALGIAMSTTMFSVVNGVVLRPPPYRDPGRLVEIREHNPLRGTDPHEASYPNFVEWRDQARSFDSMAASYLWKPVLGSGGDPRRLTAALVTGDLFRVLRVDPTLGRAFLEEERKPGGPLTVILSDGLWRDTFGADAGIVGRRISLDGQDAFVAGVMPAGFRYPTEEIDSWSPLEPHAQYFTNRAVHVVTVIGRLGPEASIDEAREEMRVIGERIQQQYAGEDPGHEITLTRLHDRMVAGVRPGLFLLLGAVILVLMIACANVASLLLARSAGRRREMAVRVSLGATRGRIVRQLLTESAVVGLVAGAAGLALSAWGLDLVTATLPASLPRAGGIRIDGAVMLFALGISLLTGFLFGLAPALHASRTSQMQEMKSQGQAGHRILVAAEVALSFILLIGTGLMMKSLWNVLATDPGFRTENVLSARLALPPAYDDPHAITRFYEQLRERLAALPGAIDATAASSLPISGGDSHGELLIENRPFPTGEAPGASFRRVMPGYFSTMGIPLIEGRDFRAGDGHEEPYVVIINESMARAHWPDESPVGKRIKVGPPENEPWLTVIGVVGDVRNVGLEQAAALDTYEPHAQRPWRTMHLILRTREDPMAAAAAVRQVLKEAEPAAPVEAVTTMTDRIAASVAPRSLTMLLFRIFSAAAVLLAAMGIYGVMSYAVTQRAREVGIRMALGARPRDVRRLILARGMRMTLAGLAAGLAGAFALTRFLASQLYEVSTLDPSVFLLVPLLLASIALLACYLPAARAGRIDPNEALRQE